MSYSCNISFKRLEASEIYPFLQQFKKAVGEKMEDIAEDNFLWVPYIRHSFDVPEKFGDVSREKRTEAEFWAYRSIFSYRYFYDAELKLLCVYSVHDCLRDMFDTTIHFQDSCDQNYNRKDWEGVSAFEEIFDKWMNCPDEDVEQHYNSKHTFTDMRTEYADSDFEKALMYYRKTYCYEEIWNRYQNTLYVEDSIVYLTLYGYYDLIHIEKFLKRCHDKYIEFHNR